MQRKRAHPHQDNMDPRCNKLVSCDYRAGVFHGHYFLFQLHFIIFQAKKRQKTLHQKKYFFWK